MTDIASEPFPAAADEAWTQQIDALKARYKHVREPVLVALNILLRDANVGLDDAKAQARLHGIRITAASVDAARRLMERMDAPEQKPTRKMPAATHRPARADSDPETLIRGLVAKLLDQENAEAERLRAAMRKAIALLQAAVGDR